MQVLAATYTQHYTPVADSVILSALVAALPIIVLLGLLGLLRVKAHVAALAGLVASLLVAIVVFGMPVTTAAAAATNGAAFGLFPIGWIVLCAIFVYDITVKTGKFEQVRQTIAGLAVDRRIQLLLIAFSFGAFIEGAAGFGTPIAICAAMLIGLGFRPLPAAGLSLIGNTAPVAFGAIGTPLITLASVTGLPLQDLSAMVGRQRHLVQRTVRQPAEDHRHPDRHLPRAGRRLQQLGRGDGQDDRRPEHRGRWGGHRPAGPRGQHPALRVLPLHRPGLPGRRTRPRAGVRVPRRGALAAPRTPSGGRTEEGPSRRSLLRPGSVVARWRIPLLGGGPGLLGRASAVASSGR
jgi:hypothetical protein